MAKKIFLNKEEELKEILLVKTLMVETIEMFHCTREVKAIKKLIKVYDILDLNQAILEKFTQSDGPCWDMASLNDLELTGRELYIYHLNDFNPTNKLKNYRTEIGRLINLAKNNLDDFIN
jgi:hypothetical protein